jgi:hypothetical protein
MPKDIRQIVILGTRITPNTLAVLYQDEAKGVTRIRIFQKGKFVSAVKFNHDGDASYYKALTKLSWKIKKPIQYVFLYPPIDPEEKSNDVK